MFRIALFALASLGPAHAAAQGLSVSPYAAVDGGLQGAPGLVGVSATLWLNPVGVRVGGAVDPDYSPLAPALGQPRARRATVWNGDLDMVVPGRAVGVTLGNVEPLVFVGFGAHGMRRPDGSAVTVPAWSYGGGAAVGMASWLTMEGEARYRIPHASERGRIDPAVGGGWEMRAGFAVHLGRASPGRPAPVSAPGGSPGLPGRAIRMDGAGVAVEAPSAEAAALARGTLHTADRLVGVPYVWGGSTPSEGFDCSGFVQYVFARHGVQLPRVSRDQGRAGVALPARVDSLHPGDLMFFAGSDGVISHVAIYVGDRRIIHSAGSRGVVGYDDLDSPRARWYATHFVAARRVIPDGSFRVDAFGSR